MSESEHSNSELYYPGEHSDAELLRAKQQKESHYSRHEAMRPHAASFHQRMKMKKRGHMIKCLMTGTGRTGKYLALGQDAGTSLCSVCTS